MRWILPFMLSLSCLAQLPVIPSGFNFPARASSTPDYTNNLFVDVETDTFSSLGSISTGTVMTEWTNIAAGNPNINAVSNSFSSPAVGTATWPVYTNNLTPSGRGAWDFSLNANQNWRPHLTGFISGGTASQPQTYFVVFQMATGSPPANGRTVWDAEVGSRILFRVQNGGAEPGPFLLNCVSGGAPPSTSSPPDGQWYVATIICDSGGNVTAMWTNGVSILNGAGCGFAGQGSMSLGNDNTLITAFNGRISAIREYSEHMSTLHQQIVETNLGLRYLGRTIP